MTGVASPPKPQRIELTAADGHRLEAWSARPAGLPKGGIVVLHAVYGATPHMGDVCVRWAAAGYHARRVVYGFALDESGALKELLADKGYDPQLGARPLRRAIQRMIEDALSEKILYKEFRAGEKIIVDLAAMKDALSDPGIIKLDVRDVDEWIGERSSPYGKDYCPRKGRIPGAKWIEWYRMMKPTPAGQRFKSREEILAECATVGITPDTPVIIYCFKGARASNTFVALEEAGIRDVRIYFGSWNEWSREAALPIEEGRPY